MIRINLIPVKVTKKKARFMNQIYVGIFVVIIAVVGVGWVAFSMKAKIDEVEQEIARNKKDLEKYKQIQLEVERFQEETSLLEKKIKVIQQLESGRNAHVRVVDQISQAIPGNVWVDSLEYSASVGKSRKGKGDLLIRGSSYEKDTVGHFISNLQSRKDVFAAVTLGSLTKKGKGGKDYYTYDLRVNLVKEKAPVIEKKKRKGKRGRKK